MTEPTKMEEKRTVFERHNLSVEVVKGADDQMLAHFYETILGTPGGLQYKHTSIKDKIENLGNLYFLVLKRAGRILGTVGLAKNELQNGDHLITSWYIRYFSIKAPLRSEKYRRKKKQPEQQQGKGMSLFLKLGYSFFENPFLLENEKATSPQCSIVYSYIEKNNHRTVGFNNEMKLMPVRDFSTILFSRFYPGKNEYVKKIQKEKIPEMKEKLKQFYSDYTMYSDKNLFFDQHYYVVEKEGEIIAGLQAYPDKWKVIDMPGKWGKLMFWLLPGLPFLKKIFNPKNFKFLAVEGIWYKKGCEKYIEDILESACTRHKINLVMMWLDSDSDLLADLDNHINFGIVNKLIERVKGEVRVKFINFKEEDKAEYYNKPAYLSSFDMS